MLCASRLSTIPTWIDCPPQSLIHHAIFSQAGPWRLVDCLPPMWEYGRCLSQEHNDTLPSSGAKPRVDNLRLPTYALIQWAASPLVWILALCVFPKDTTARYAQCGDRTSNLRSFNYNSALEQTRATPQKLILQIIQVFLKQWIWFLLCVLNRYRGKWYQLLDL